MAAASSQTNGAAASLGAQNTHPLALRSSIDPPRSLPARPRYFVISIQPIAVRWNFFFSSSSFSSLAILRKEEREWSSPRRKGEGTLLYINILEDWLMESPFFRRW